MTACFKPKKVEYPSTPLQKSIAIHSMMRRNHIISKEKGQEKTNPQDNQFQATAHTSCGVENLDQHFG